MLVNSKSRGEFDVLVKDDTCRVRYWGLDYFDSVIDVGANVGVFSIMMRMLHPQAKIVAIEPSHRSIELLKSNVSNMDIDIDERGLGDGSVQYHRFGRKKSPVADFFVPEKHEESSFSIQTEPFWKLFEDNGYEVGDRLFVKIDCEGGEQYLVGDVKSEKVLQTARQIFLEIHFRAERNPRCDDYIPEFDLYKEWVYDVFSRTHSINLALKMEKGHGQYCIRRKNLRE